MKVTVNAGSIGTSIVAEHAHIRIGADGVEQVVSLTRALLLAANPRDTTRLRLDEEARSIDAAIQRGQHRDRFEFVTQWAVRRSDLSTHIMRYRPDILHFAGHSNQGGLILEDGNGCSSPLQVDELPPLLKLLDGQTRCVVLNACFTIQAASLLAKHVSCVVGTSRPIGDFAAIEFAAGFYEALSHGECIQTAFDVGSHRFVHADGDIDRDIGQGTVCDTIHRDAPVLLGRDDPRHVRFF